ncbi:QWRF motif-containing protein 8 [Striga hermonthica]|uniref:QWRF motif-containing protein 8 n=1 Tax=Striga hermonthica TaxID=68872 RepID=A0A9N7MSG8_STRHE|nr:QWRF motif-containing protein 8 [Striga hermonthica]
MDVYESENPLKNGTTRRGRTREVSSRYKSPIPNGQTRCPSPTPNVPKRCPSPTRNVPKRCPSPNATSRTLSSSSAVAAPKRSLSAERKRPSTPSRPNTPVRDTNAESIFASNKTAGSKLPDSLWPSTMRSLNSSFQSDKSEKTADRTLRPPSNVARVVEARKPTPERKRSPLKGKNSPDLVENSKPAFDILRHQWPSRVSGKTSANPVLKADVTLDKTSKIPSLSRTRVVPTITTPPVRRLSLDGMASKPIQKSASDLLMLMSRDESRVAGLSRNSVDDRWLRSQRPSSSSSDRSRPSSPKPVSRSRPSSPSTSRGVSPSRAKVVGPCSRGSSPGRVRPSSPKGNNSHSSASVLTFMADINKGKKVDRNIEDAHQLRLLYNRHLQWRFANARAVALLRSQKAKAEKMLCNVWRVIIDLWSLVREKRSDFQQLKLKLKVYSVLDSQAIFLEEWTLLEKDHTNSLTRAIQDLEASTLRIPVTGGARVDIKTLKEAVCSAVDVMSSMGSSLWSILPKVEGMNWLVLELADVAARQRAMLDECESLLGSIAKLQVEEDCLRTHILQMRQTMKNGAQSTFD